MFSLLIAATAVATPVAALADTVTVASAPGVTTYTSTSAGNGTAVAYNNVAYGTVPGGQFVSTDANGGPVGIVNYVGNFTLLAGETYTGTLSFEADDYASVLVNGVSVYSPTSMAMFNAPTTITLASSDFTSGANTLTLVDNNTGGPGGVDFAATLTGTSTSVTPEPSSFVLLGTGLLGAVGVARRRLFA